MNPFIRIGAGPAFLAAILFYSLPASSEMYVCGRADGTSVMRNIPCAAPERTVSVDGMHPDMWEKRKADKQVSDFNAKAKEEAAVRAEERKRAAGTGPDPVRASESPGGVVGTGGAGGEGARAVLDPTGPARAIMEINRPQGR